MQITVEVKDKRAISPKDTIVCGNSDYTINFVFDEDWAEFKTKTARFEYNGGFEEVVFEGNICPVPILRNTTSCGVGVYAGNLIATTKAVIGCEKSILCESTYEHEEPTADVYTQLMGLLSQSVVAVDGPQISLETNTVYSGELSGDVCFTLPDGVDARYENRVRMLAHVAADTTIDWGTTTYYGAAVPFVNEGDYEFLWDFNPLLGVWVAGATRIGQVAAV